MSDVMLLGVLRMPQELLTSELSLLQFIDRARQAADRIEDDAERIEALKRDAKIANARADQAEGRVIELELELEKRLSAAEIGKAKTEG